jgi:hypothetical protein
MMGVLMTLMGSIISVITAHHLISGSGILFLMIIRQQLELKVAFILGCF